MRSPGTLTRSSITKAFVKTNGYTPEHAHETVEITMELIKRELESGDDTMISGFGKFCLRKKRPRRGRNPATGPEPMPKPRRFVTFHC